MANTTESTIILSNDVAALVVDSANHVALADKSIFSAVDTLRINTNGTFLVDDIQVNGSNAIPEPATAALWTVVNERDELGDQLVPDYLTSVREAAFYGWPYSYYGQHVDARVRPQRPDLVARAIAPDYALGSYVAPLGLAAIRQMALFFASQGAAAVDPDGIAAIFETPIALPLPETLNFIP